LSGGTSSNSEIQQRQLADGQQQQISTSKLEAHHPIGFLANPGQHHKRDGSGIGRYPLMMFLGHGHKVRTASNTVAALIQFSEAFLGTCILSSLNWHTDHVKSMGSKGSGSRLQWGQFAISGTSPACTAMGAASKATAVPKHH